MNLRLDRAGEMLPHRYPFLFVDRVIETVPGRRAVAELNVGPDMPYTATGAGGAFPDMLVIEAMAQAGALAAAGAGEGEAVPVKGYLAGLNDVRFHGRAYPGDVVRMELDYVARMGPMVRFNGRASIDGIEIASCGLTFTVEE